LDIWQLAVLIKITEKGEITKTAHAAAIKAGTATSAQEARAGPSIKEGKQMKMDWDAAHRGATSDTVKASVQNSLCGLLRVQICQNAPDSEERRLIGECRALFDTAKFYFQDTKVLLNPTNDRYTLPKLTFATNAKWDIVFERTAAIEEQDPLGIVGASELMQHFI